MYKRRKKGPSPISSLRVSEYPRTTNKRKDKITLRGEVERAYEELGRVRGLGHLGTSVRGIWRTY